MVYYKILRKRLYIVTVTTFKDNRIVTVTILKNYIIVTPKKLKFNKQVRLKVDP